MERTHIIENIVDDLDIANLDLRIQSDGGIGLILNYKSLDGSTKSQHFPEGMDDYLSAYAYVTDLIQEIRSCIA